MPDHCIVCDGRSFTLGLRKDGRDIWRCRGCRLEMQHPLPTLDALAALYEREYAQGFGVDYLRDAPLNRLRARLRYQQLAPSCRPGRWLDVGCASGEFVATAAEGGQQAEGIDLAATAVAHGVAQGLRLRAMRLEDLADGDLFDTITGFDVIEHVTDPAALLDGIRARLVAGGTVALSTPNLRSWTRAAMGKSWLFYLPNVHLFYFDPDSIGRLVRRVGLQLVRIEKCYKHITGIGLADELRLHRGAHYRLAERVLRAMPTRLLERPIALDLGEMLIVARRPVI